MYWQSYKSIFGEIPLIVVKICQNYKSHMDTYALYGKVRELITVVDDPLLNYT